MEVYDVGCRCWLSGFVRFRESSWFGFGSSVLDLALAPTLDFGP